VIVAAIVAAIVAVAVVIETAKFQLV